MTTKNKTLVNVRTVEFGRAVFNILAVLSHMLENGTNDNSAWYTIEGEKLSQVALELGYSPEVYISAIACFSPSIRWDKNTSEVLRMAQMVNNGATLQEVLSARFMGYPANVRKAFEILKTGDSSILSGQKVTRFRDNLLGHESTVTIDRHACNVAINGMWCGASGELIPTAAMYTQLSKAYSVAAKIAFVMYGCNFTASSVQAITWGFVSANASNHNTKENA